MGDCLQPPRHDLDRVNRVAGKEQRHGQHLPDAHEELAGLDVFTCRENKRLPLFVSERVKRDLEAEACSGIEFSRASVK